MVPPGSAVCAKMLQLGINGIFVLTRNGSPLLIRDYRNNLDQEGADLRLIGFLSAFSRFAFEETDGLISDLGMHTTRLFFDFSEDILYLLSLDELVMQHYPFHQLRTLLKGTLREIKIIERDLFSNDSESVDQLVRDVGYYKHLRQTYDELGPHIDTLVLKSYEELRGLLLG